VLENIILVVLRLLFISSYSVLSVVKNQLSHHEAHIELRGISNIPTAIHLHFVEGGDFLRGSG
jgi:hypothetical protein